MPKDLPVAYDRRPTSARGAFIADAFGAMSICFTVVGFLCLPGLM